MPAKKKTIVSKHRSAKQNERSLVFSTLVEAIQRVHEQSAAAVSRTINTTLTLRNWVIGWYLREYEQQGADRAKYGDALLDRVAERLRAEGLSDITARYLRLCRQFASVYSEIWRSVTAKSEQALLPDSIWQSLTAKSEAREIKNTARSGIAKIRKSATSELGAPPQKLFTTLSFTHLAELIAISDKDHTLVEYATASMDNRLFVSKYQLELPSKEDLQRFLEMKRKEVSGTP